jgi:hypothetical protein
MLKTHVIIRQSLDWGNISLSEFREQSREFCRLINRPPDQVNLAVDLWNRTFRHSFFKVRQEIKDIAIENFDSLADAQVFNSVERIDRENFEEGFYIFIDDDDWLHPEIASLLSDNADSRQENAIVWGSVAFGTTTDRIITRRKPDGFCYTNNYAITGKFLSESPENFDRVFQHFGANETFKQPDVKIIDEYWSVTNKNPSSTVYLEQVLKDDFSSNALKSGVAGYLQRYGQIEKEIDPSLQWARPLMDKMAGIFSKL